MKYIKTFEKIDKQKDLKRLFNHIVDVFGEYYGYQINKFETSYEILFYNVDSTYLFCIRVSGFDGRSIYVSKNVNDGICSYIFDYFKTLKGLEIRLYDEHRVMFNIIDKNIDNLINQIYKEDFDLKYQASKYNI